MDVLKNTFRAYWRICLQDDAPEIDFEIMKALCELHKDALVNQRQLLTDIVRTLGNADENSPKTDEDWQRYINACRELYDANIGFKHARNLIIKITDWFEEKYSEEDKQ